MDQEKQNFKRNTYFHLGITPEDGTLNEEELLEYIGINQETYREIIAAITAEVQAYANDPELPAEQDEKNYLDLIVDLFNKEKDEISKEKMEVESGAKKNNLTILEQLLKEYQFTDTILNHSNEFNNQIVKINMIINLILNHFSPLIKSNIQYKYDTIYCEEILQLLAKKVIYNLSLYGVDPRVIALSNAHYYLPSPILDEITNQITEAQWNEILNNESIEDFVKINIYLLSKQKSQEVIKYLQDTTNNLKEDQDFLREIHMIFSMAINWNNKCIIQYIIDRFFKITESAGKILSEVFIRGNYEVCLKFIQPKIWNSYTDDLKTLIIETIILRSGDITGAKLITELKNQRLITLELFRYIAQNMLYEQEAQIIKIQEILLPIIAENIANKWDNHEDKIGLLKLVIIIHRGDQENIILKHLHNEVLLNYGHYKTVFNILRNMGLQGKTKKLFSKYIKLLKAENNKALHGEIYIPGENEDAYATGYTKEEFISSFKILNEKEQLRFIKKTANKIEKIIKNKNLNFKEKNELIKAKIKKIEFIIEEKNKTYKEQQAAEKIILKILVNGLSEEIGYDHSVIKILKEIAENKDLSLKERIDTIERKMEELEHLLPQELRDNVKKTKSEARNIESLIPPDVYQLTYDEAVTLKEKVTQFYSNALLEEGDESMTITPETSSKKKKKTKGRKDKKEEKNNESNGGKLLYIEIGKNGQIGIATSSGKKHLEVEKNEKELKQEEIRTLLYSETPSPSDNQVKKKNEPAPQPKPSPKKEKKSPQEQKVSQVKLSPKIPAQDDNRQQASNIEENQIKPLSEEEVKHKAEKHSSNNENKADTLKTILNIPKKLGKKQKASSEMKKPAKQESKLPIQVDEAKQYHIVDQQKFIYPQCNAYYVNSQGKIIEAFTLPGADSAINQYGEHISIANTQLFKQDSSQSTTLRIPCNIQYLDQNQNRVEGFLLPGASCIIDEYGNQFSINSEVHAPAPPAQQVLVIEHHHIIYIPVVPASNYSSYPPYSTGGYNMQSYNNGNNHPGGGGGFGGGARYANKHNNNGESNKQESSPEKPIILITTSLGMVKKIMPSAERQEFEESIKETNDRLNNQYKLSIKTDEMDKFEFMKPYNASYVPIDIDDNLMPKLPIFLEGGVKLAGAEEEGMNFMPVM